MEWFALKQVRTPELMDDPNLDPVIHADALAGLARLNKLSSGAKSLWDEIAKVRSACATDELTLLDIASGGGDILLDLASRANQAQLKLRITGSDFSATAVDLAKRKLAPIVDATGSSSSASVADAAVANAINFVRLDALQDSFPGPFDIVSTSLFTHHLDAQQVVLLLQKMYQVARKCVIVSDLDRSFINLILVWLATRVVTRSPIVHFDGPVSVRAAYTGAEFLDLAKGAGLKEAQVHQSHPARFILTCYKHDAGDGGIYSARESGLNTGLSN